MLWREAQKRLQRRPRKHKLKMNDMNHSWINVAKPCPSPPSMGCGIWIWELGDLEPHLGPSEETDVGSQEMPPLKDQYGTAQLQDPTLENALRNVQVLEGTLVRSRVNPSYPHFAVKKGLLYQVVKDTGTAVSPHSLARSSLRGREDQGKGIGAFFLAGNS